MRGWTSLQGLWQGARPLGDVSVALLAFYCAFWLRIHLHLPFTLDLLPADRISFFFDEWWVVTLGQVAMLYFFGFYDPPGPSAEVQRRLIAGTLLLGLVLMGYIFLTNRTFPRSVLVLFVGLDLALLSTWRGLLRRLHRPRQRRVVIVGSGPAAQELARAIHEHGWHGLEVVGHVPAPDDPPIENPAEDRSLGPQLGSIDDVRKLVLEGQVDDLILAPSAASWQTRLLDGLAGLGPERSNVLLLPGPYESLIGRMRYRWVRDLPLIEVVRQTEWRINRPVKRGLDVVLGSLLLLLCLPILAVCALLIRLTSPGPVFYRQTRVGVGQQTFEVWKLRTMHQDAERATGAVLATTNDPRLTPVGGFLRRARLDEVPQLFQVLRGHMSLVGPRPERPNFVEQFLRDVPGYAERFSVPPGVTGLAQINGDYHSSAPNKLRYDLAYLANWSLWLDLSILLRTVKIVLTSRGV